MLSVGLFIYFLMVCVYQEKEIWELKSRQGLTTEVAGGNTEVGLYVPPM